MIILKTISVVSLVILITIAIPKTGKAVINGRGPTGSAVVLAASSTGSRQQVPLPNNISGQVFDSLGRPAQVQIIFKKQTAEQEQAGLIFPGIVYLPPPPLITDVRGYYQLHLDDGNWLGYACGSQTGYQPLFWEVGIFDNVITSYKELSHVSPIIENVSVPLPDTRNPSPSLNPGTEITVTGNWFGCSGKLLMEIDGRQEEITRFIIHQNKLLKFTLPDFSSKGVSQVTDFRVIYISGDSRSNIVFWEMPKQAHPAWQEAAVTSSELGATATTTSNTARKQRAISSKQKKPFSTSSAAKQKIHKK